MTSEVIINLINTCAFPIAMCVIMVLFIKYSIEKFDKMLKEERDNYNACVNKLTDSNIAKVEKLTDSIGDLCTKIDILLDRRE